MKKLIAFTLLLSGLFLTSQLFAQGDVKSNEKQPATEQKKDPNATNTGKDQNVQTGGYTKSGKQITAPQTTQEQAKDQQEKVSAATVQGNSRAAGSAVYDKMGNAIAKIGADGKIIDPSGKVLAQYTSNGDYFGPDGNKIASIKDGVIRTKDGAEIARLSKDGKVTNAKGKLLGTIYDDGTIRNRNGSRLGSAPGVDKNIAVMMFFNKKKPSSGEKKPVTDTQPAMESKPVKKY
jgi:hypothetical protein